ncbi:UNVERIFIED_CONTAM: reverse transcriptase domain-containing protein [Ralstonia mannitolilytica]
MTSKISLLEKISDISYLENAWNQLYKFNKHSRGLSGETIEYFSKNKEDKLKSISDKLKNKEYKFSGNRGVLIPKNGKNKFRPLQIPEISDRVVIKAIALELEEIFSETIKKSEGFSFAYQKKIGVKEAVLKIQEHYNNGYHYVLEADLINFFGTVNKKELLENKIFTKLSDNSINELISNSLNQKVGNLKEFDDLQKKYFEGIENGIPQGNALSPLLSNIYLSKFDLELIKDNYKLVRYADDFVIMCKSSDECENAYTKSLHLLKCLNLEIHPLEKGEKTKITNILKESLTFLSVTFDGKALFPSLDNFKRLQNKLWELNKGKVELSLIDYFAKLKNKHEGWVSAFIYTDILRYSEELDFLISRIIYLKLKQIQWSLTPTTLNKIPKKYSTKNTSRYCLSDIQRQNSGIPFTSTLILEKLNKIKQIK